MSLSPSPGPQIRAAVRGKSLEKKDPAGPIHGSGRRHHCNGRKGDEKETVAPHIWPERENKATRGETVANAYRQRLVGGPSTLRPAKERHRNRMGTSKPQ